MATNTRGTRGATAGRTAFTYQPRSAAAATDRINKYNTGNRESFLLSDVPTYTPKEGDNWIRILPPTWPDAEHYAYDLYVHYEVGPDNNAYLCPERMKGAPCPLCDELRKAKAAGQEEYAGALESSLRLAAWIVDRDETSKGVQLWMYSPTIDREILEQSRDKRTGEVLMIDHPTAGYDVEFTRKGKGLHTKYSGIKLSRQASAIEESFLAFVVDNPLPSKLKFYDGAHMAEAFGGVAGGGGSDAEEPPHEAPASEASAGGVLRPGANGANGATAAAQPAAAVPATTRRRAAPAAAATKGPDFTKMDINAQLDWADAHSIIVPDNIPDDGVAAFLAAEAAKLPA